MNRTATHKSLAELRELFMDMAFHYGAIHILRRIHQLFHILAQSFILYVNQNVH